MSGILFIISSPSGGGKGTLIKEILATTEKIGYSVSYTTRNMREGEFHGRDYFFVSVEQFNDLIEKGEFLEYAEVHGNFYGTSVNQVKTETEMGRDVILEIDIQGADSIKAKILEAVGVFILPPSFEVLKNRLIRRQTEGAEDLALRLKNAGVEVRHFKDFEYVVINDDKAVAASDLRAIITAERLKQVRQSAKIEAIINTFDFTDD
ncbi:MAG: guanylate kinase [Pyrinomonadaceae bacterium]